MSSLVSTVWPNSLFRYSSSMLTFLDVPGLMPLYSELARALQQQDMVSNRSFYPAP
jgi:hypothetical protein